MNSLVVLSQHSFQLINIPVILFLLEGNVHDGFANIVIHFLKLLGFLDQNSELILKIDLISIFSCLDQNLLF